MSRDILQRFCATQAFSRQIQAPFAWEQDGECWSAATDLVRLLVLRGRFVEPQADARNAENAQRISARLATAPVLGEIDLAELAAFCGAPSEKRDCTSCTNGRVPCTECDGSGEVECECPCGHEHERGCSDCDGAGHVPCPDCRGWSQRQRAGCRVLIGDAVFDRAVIASCLVDAERMTGVATLVSAGEEQVHALLGEDWRLVFMPMARNSGYPVSEMPRFAGLRVMAQAEGGDDA